MLSHPAVRPVLQDDPIRQSSSAKADGPEGFLLTSPASGGNSISWFSRRTPAIQSALRPCAQALRSSKPGDKRITMPKSRGRPR
jgi:hypothetical protein